LPPADDAELRDELRRLVDLDLGPEHGDPDREPLEVVIGGPVLAAVRVDPLERPREPRKARLDLLRRSVHGDARLVTAAGAGDALLYEGGGVLRRQRARPEPLAARRRPRQPVDAEGAPVLAAAVPRDQVPAPSEVHQ
jgi:hypothetical protein